MSNGRLHSAAAMTAHIFPDRFTVPLYSARSSTALLNRVKIDEYARLVQTYNLARALSRIICLIVIVLIASVKYRVYIILLLFVLARCVKFPMLSLRWGLSQNLYFERGSKRCCHFKTG